MRVSTWFSSVMVKPYNFLCNSLCYFPSFTLPLFLDRLEGDEDEPDLPLLSTLDFAALKDVRETGEEYCRSFTKLLHETPGLQPGYLPQPDALYLLSGVSIYLCYPFVFNPYSITIYTFGSLSHPFCFLSLGHAHVDSGVIS